MEQMVIIQVGKDELSKIVNDAVRAALPKEIRESDPKPFIKGIIELSKFLRVSPSRAQKLKNEGVIPYWQDGRTLLFDPNKVREAMDAYFKKGNEGKARK